MESLEHGRDVLGPLEPEHDKELVAGVACDRVVIVETAPQDGSALADGQVPHVVAPRVVDGLQVVHVHHEHGGGVGGLRVGDDALHDGIQLAAVGQARHVVGAFEQALQVHVHEQEPQHRSRLGGRQAMVLVCSRPPARGNRGKASRGTSWPRGMR